MFRKAHTLGFFEIRSTDVRGRLRCVTLTVNLKRGLRRVPKTPRGKRVVDASTGSFQVVNKAPNGEAVPYFDKSRGVWVAPWRKPDGKVGRPTGKTRVLAAASRDRHMAKSAEEERFAALDEGFEADSTIADVTDWWLQNVARHRVRATTFATYRKQARLIEASLGRHPGASTPPRSGRSIHFGSA